MNRISALVEVARDQTRPQEERDSAITALKNIADTGESFHERETALHVLKNLDGPATDKLSANTLELLELMGMTVEDYRRVINER